MQLAFLRQEPQEKMCDPNIKPRVWHMFHR